MTSSNSNFIEVAKDASIDDLNEVTNQKRNIDIFQQGPSPKNKYVRHAQPKKNYVMPTGYNKSRQQANTHDESQTVHISDGGTIDGGDKTLNMLTPYST